MTKVKNVRNGNEFELLSVSETGVKLKDLESGKEKIITNEVYNKWYKVVEDSTTETVTEEESIVETTEPESEVEEEVPEEPTPKKPRAKKEKAPKAPKEPKSKEPHILKDVLEKILKAIGCEIFITQVKGFHTVKVDGRMAMAYTFSTKGIVLWMRSKAIEHLDIETKYMKHMFDRRLNLYENNEENVELIRTIVTACVEDQKKTNQMKEAKKQARLEYLKEKEAKKEAKKKKDMEAKFGVKSKKRKKDEEASEEQPDAEQGEE